MLIYVLIIFLLFLCYFAPKSKGLSFCFLALCIITWGLNTYNGDYRAYERFYNEIISFENLIDSPIEAGFYVLCLIGKQILGLSFQQFVFFIALITMIGLWIIVIHISKYPAMVMGLYFISPFFPCDINQMRNTIAELFIILAMHIMINKGNLKKYIVLIFIATLFHISSIFYLLFLPYWFFTNRKQIVIFVLSVTAFTSAAPRILSAISPRLAHKIGIYMTRFGLHFNLKSILLCLVILFNIFLIKRFARKCQNRNNAGIIRNAYEMHLFSLISLPIIVMYNFNFYRIIRNLLVVDYYTYSVYLDDRNRINCDKYVFLIAAMSFYWSAVNMISQWNVILQNNLLFRYLWL